MSRQLKLFDGFSEDDFRKAIGIHLKDAISCIQSNKVCPYIGSIESLNPCIIPGGTKFQVSL